MKLQPLAAAVLVCGLGFSAGPVLASDVAEGERDDSSQYPAEWLERMAEAVDAISYTGTFVHIGDGRTETLGVVHRGSPDGPRERLFSLTGSQQEVLRDKKKVRCVHEEADTKRLDLRQTSARFFAHVAKDGADSFADAYELVDLGADRVAGRPCQVIGIRPLDELRYGFRFWIDRETGMPLRTELVDRDGEALRKLMFTQFDPQDEIDDSQLEATLDGDGEAYDTRRASYSDRDREKGQKEAEAWQLDTLPEGFRISFGTRKSREDGQDLFQLVVTDGLARVSIFAEALAEGESAMEGISSMGLTNAYGRALEGHQVTVVGEVPSETVRRVAEAVKGLPDAAGDEE